VDPLLNHVPLNSVSGVTGVPAVKIVEVEHKKEHVRQAKETVVVDQLLNHVTLKTVSGVTGVLALSIVDWEDNSEHVPVLENVALDSISKIVTLNSVSLSLFWVGPALT
jgi:hypothetical protein